MRGPTNSTALHLLLERGDNTDHRAVTLLLGAGADPKAVTIYGNTPLHTLVSSCKEDYVFTAQITTALLAAGAEVNAVDSLGRVSFI